jgi:hypothetical protein
MLRKLGLVTLLLSLALPASAAGKPGTISGFVRDNTGVPQMGAVVEILGSASSALRVFTDEKGHYTAAGLLPGSYTVKVTMPSFMPSLRERIGIRPGSSLLVNFTLSTIFDVLQLAPGSGPAEADDWKWTLRSVANRPILRVLEEDPSVLLASSESRDPHPLKGSVSFVAGSSSGGFGSSSDMSTGFSLEHSLFSSGTVALQGKVGYGGALPASVLRASYSHNLPSGSRPEVAFTARRFESPGSNLPALQALALSASDSLTLGDAIELNFGSELQSVQFMGRVNAFRPFGSADIHLSPNTVVEYRYATSIPNGRLDKGFDSAPADLSEANPRVSLAAFAPALERAHHSEVSVSRRMGKTRFQVAAFADRISNTALVGVGDISADSGSVLPDVYSGTFTYRGSNLETNGFRAVLQRQLNSDLTATLDYSYGGVLDLAPGEQNLLTARSSLQTVSRHAVAGKVSGTIPRAKTHWITSYRWTSGQALTPVDLFNASPGQADPYLNVFVRQPIPHVGFLNVKMEALLEIRNLMAQGYVPMLGADGRTVYLVQSARAVRGGVAFNF